MARHFHPAGRPGRRAGSGQNPGDPLRRLPQRQNEAGRARPHLSPRRAARRPPRPGPRPRRCRSQPALSVRRAPQRAGHAPRRRQTHGNRLGRPRRVDSRRRALHWPPRRQNTLGVRSRAPARRSRRRRPSHRRLPRPVRRTRQSLHAPAPRLARPHRLAPHARRNQRLPGRPIPRRLGRRRRPPPRQPALRRTLGPPLDGYLALQRLDHRIPQRQQKLRPNGARNARRQ